MSDALDAQTFAATLASAERGDPAAASELFTLLYAELRRLANRQLHANAGGLTLGATTLLHEAYMDMAGRGAAFPDRARFFAYASRAMRGLIIDYVRERRALKRGGEFHLTSLNTEHAESVPQAENLSRLDDALGQLAWRSRRSRSSSTSSISAACPSPRSPSCEACPSARSSASGPRRVCTCTTRSRTTDGLAGSACGIRSSGCCAVQPRQEREATWRGSTSRAGNG